jgi:predicted AAA+ superfamily ATPase
VANRKIYTIDAGIINTISINFSPNIGKIYENTVFIKLYTQKILEQSEIYYWQDINKKEVDFVIKKDNKITELIQVCHDVSNYDTKKRETSALIKAGAELKCTNLTIITGDYESKEKEIKYIPLWKWLTQ